MLQREAVELYNTNDLLKDSLYIVTFLIEDHLRCFFSPIDPEVHPQNEDYWGHVNPIGPRACYDEGKRVAETMCYAYMKQVLNLYQIQWIFCI